MSNAQRKAATRAALPPHLTETGFLTRYFNFLADNDRRTFGLHCQEVHGEHWRREWAERKAKAAAA